MFGDLLFVVERDNHRVQVLPLPGFAPVGSFGDGELRSPYGLWLTEAAPGELEVYVTDSFMDGARFDVVPPLAQLGPARAPLPRAAARTTARCACFDAHYLGAFGDTSEAAALRMVESHRRRSRATTAC